MPYYTPLVNCDKLNRKFYLQSVVFLFHKYYHSSFFSVSILWYNYPVQIPSHATKVFQGILFSVWQWEQKLYDGTTTTFEALKRTGTILIIPTQKESVFLSYEEQPMKERSYTLLGGRQEENEDPLVTAKRELLEETGMESHDWELFQTIHSEGKVQWDTYVFIARNCIKIQEQKLDAGERIEVKKVSFNEFLRIVSSESFWGQNIANIILRMMLSQEALLQLQKKLFQG